MCSGGRLLWSRPLGETILSRGIEVGSRVFKKLMAQIENIFRICMKKMVFRHILNNVLYKYFSARLAYLSKVGDKLSHT